ncbi:DMT family transporter [Ectobacillus panaciterrae]|uniref:DMT family transporter n=1 Tax=Ectobacillus panaciterrae TaxID=363872 RepID=UPI000402394C|nr:multidrug efflux SMR transporter [Ectobacillus panaciterrae]
MAWIYIMIAGLLEIVWVIGLKYSNGFTELIPSMLTVGIIIFSFFLLSKALRSIPVGTGYAVFTGLGTVGTVAIGVTFWGETINLLKVFFVILMIFGIIGLKIIPPNGQAPKEVK